jgi:calcium/calmodulin-dependent protein kinase I
MWSFGVILYILLGGYPPFYDKNDQLLYRKIMRGQYQFHEDYWGQVSDDAKDLIRHLLVVKPEERFTVDQALAHHWLHIGDENLNARDISNSLTELRKFQIRKKLRSGMKAVLSVARMRLLVQKSKGPSLTSIQEVIPASPSVDPVEYDGDEGIDVEIPDDAIMR